MPVNRKFWLEPFFKNNFPNLNCPRCGIGILRPVDNSFQYWESADSREFGRKHLIENRQSFDENTMLGMDASVYRYSVLLKCNNSNCLEHLASCGSGHVIDEYDSTLGDTVFYDSFAPEYFYPPIHIFPIPKECPEQVAEEIISSFKLFFSDPSASANYVRKATDSILTEKGIKRYSISKGKRKRINLHDRIVLFQSREPESAKKLFAIKWLGNEGSHADTITKNDVLDAYEILESILDDLYVGYRKLVDKKVALINKHKRSLHPST